MKREIKQSGASDNKRHTAYLEKYLTGSMKEYIRVNDPVWFYLHTTLSALAGTLCFVVVLLGGAMTSVYTKDPTKRRWQIAALCSIVSLWESSGPPSPHSLTFDLSVAFFSSELCFLSW